MFPEQYCVDLDQALANPFWKGLDSSIVNFVGQQTKIGDTV